MICSVYQSGSSITRSIYPDVLHPLSRVEITNLTINPGDLVTMLICTAQGAGSTSATIYFGNQTSGISTSYTITAPGGHQAGRQQRRMDRRNSGVNGVLTQMPDYGEVFFSTCDAGLTNGTTVNGGTGNNINLVQAGATVSTGALITPNVIQCQYAA